MKIEIWWIGKTSPAYLTEGVQLYERRLRAFWSVRIVTLPLAKKGKKWTPQQHQEAEADRILSALRPQDQLVLLDETGKVFNSVQFSQFVERQCAHHPSKLIFLIGGAHGFAPSVYARAHTTVSLSRMTFSHQLVRLIFLEQLYRAAAIAHHHPYHNE